MLGNPHCSPAGDGEHGILDLELKVVMGEELGKGDCIEKQGGGYLACRRGGGC